MALVTRKQFDAAVMNCEFPQPTTDQFNNFVGRAANDGGITDTRELAMFLAQVIHETGGLTKLKETDPMPDYGRYSGRGYMQLTWDYNYRACSNDLFGDDRLLKNPELVADDDSIAWGSAFWFWKTNVHNDPGVQRGQFGSATRKINGGLECDGPHTDKARKRYNYYQKVFNAFSVPGQPIEGGCYN